MNFGQNPVVLAKVLSGLLSLSRKLWLKYKVMTASVHDLSISSFSASVLCSLGLLTDSNKLQITVPLD